MALSDDELQDAIDQTISRIDSEADPKSMTPTQALQFYVEIADHVRTNADALREENPGIKEPD